MIVYQLACPEGHGFEGWFASSEACEREAREGRLACPACGSSRVQKRPSAPYVHASGTSAVAGGAPAAEPAAGVREQALGALKAFVLANTENVGPRFAEVARRIHYGEEEGRGIRGRVTAEQAVELEDEGISTLALPPGVVLGDEVH